MFYSARIKLTLWYLLIIMSVSTFFSLLIHRVLMGEVNRMARAERFRFERVPFDAGMIHPIFLDEEFLDQVRKRITFGLIIINGVILISSGWLGYVLAGKTLKPIADMVKEQDRFISDASHEFRTPLTSLRTAMEVSLRDRNMNIGGAKKLINDSLNEVNKLQTLSEGLLQLTQYQHTGNNLKFEKLSLHEVVADSVEKIKPLADRKKIKIKQKVENLKIKGNKFSLTDLLIIVLDNAVKYSGEKTTVTVESKKTEKYVNLSIKDQGIGIAKKDFSHIFDRFYRADEARTKSSNGGYGLGLSIAKRIVDIHNGKIKVESVLGKGTTVKIALPKFS